MDKEREDAVYKMVYEIFKQKGVIEELLKRIQRIEYKVTHTAKRHGLGTEEREDVVEEKMEVPTPRNAAKEPSPPKVVNIGGHEAKFQ